MTTGLFRWLWALIRLGTMVAVCIIVQGVGPASCGADRPSPSPQSNEAFEQNKRLGRGINILGYDPIWQSAKDARFRKEYFTRIRDAGFDHVRINLHPFRDAKPNGKLDDHYWQTLDWVVQQALDNKLAVVLDFHEFLEMAKEPHAKKGPWLNFWKQAAERYKNAPPEVMFEILNEPHKKMTPELWNRWLREALAVVRKTNPRRTVIVGPANWNSIDSLEQLHLPANDRNIIVTVHYYHPFAFTHQGTPWMDEYKDKLGVRWEGSPEQRQAIRRDFDRAQAWATKHRRPLYLGEFGAYDKAEMASRARYINQVAREAERHGWSWAYWQFDSDFCLFDQTKQQWIRPLLDALIPQASH